MSKSRNILIDRLIQRLHDLIDPSFKDLGIPQINFVKETLYIILTVKKNDAQNYKALQDEIQRTAESLVKELNETLSVAVLFTHDKPLPFKKAIAVASGKGGVGKSTTAIGLAYALCDQGLRVGFLDADIYGPSLPVLLGHQDKPQIDENHRIVPIAKDGMQFISMGFLLQHDTPVIWRGPMVSQAIQRFLTGVAWDRLDVLVIDLPPGTGDIQLTLIQKAALSGAVIVSTPQPMALIDARKAIEMFNKVSIPILGMVENMSTFVCPHCQGQSDIFEHGGAQKVAHALNLPFLGEIPIHLDIRRFCDEGEPIKLLSSLKDKPYQAIARNLTNQLNMLYTSNLKLSGTP